VRSVLQMALEGASDLPRQGQREQMHSVHTQNTWASGTKLRATGEGPETTYCLAAVCCW